MGNEICSQFLCCLLIVMGLNPLDAEGNDGCRSGSRELGASMTAYLRLSGWQDIAIPRYSIACLRQVRCRATCRSVWKVWRFAGSLLPMPPLLEKRSGGFSGGVILMTLVRPP